MLNKEYRTGYNDAYSDIATGRPRRLLAGVSAEYVKGYMMAWGRYA